MHVFTVPELYFRYDPFSRIPMYRRTRFRSLPRISKEAAHLFLDIERRKNLYKNIFSTKIGAMDMNDRP